MARTAMLLLSLLAASAIGAAGSSETAVTIPEVDVVPAENVASAPRSMRVLFIGNSHTYTNGGIDLHVSRMAKLSDPPILFGADSVTISGATLEEHWQADSQGRIAEGDYDIVVLQGHIPRNPSPKATSFLEYSRRFDATAAAYGAETVFFMSGPHPDYPEIGLMDIIKAHRKISRELDAKVAPVAIAARRVHQQRPGLDLLSADGIHASWAGTYLAAAVVYATLFDRSPEGIDYAFGVSDEDAAYLQRIAWESVEIWNANGRGNASGRG